MLHSDLSAANDSNLVVDLFAGPGGWDQGLRAAGYTGRLIGVEWDTDACNTARAAGHERLQEDVSALDPKQFGSVRGLIASPPCQGFSMAGKGKGRADAEHLLAAIDRVRTVQDLQAAIAELRDTMADPRSLFVLEPLRYVLTLAPAWTTWEQVPAVQPIWDRCAEVLRRVGYTVDTAILHSEQYGVPQTRRRSVLVAHSPENPVFATLPAPTHSRYHSRNPGKLDDGMQPWVSMARALGWDRDDLVGFPRRDDGRGAVTIDGVAYRARDLREAGLPAQVVTEKSRSWQRFPVGSVDDVVYVNGNRPNSARRPADKPAPTVHFGARMNEVTWQFAGAGATANVTAGQRRRELTEPAHTITGKGTAVWTPIERDGEVLPRHDRELVQSGLWPHNGPATTVCGDSRIFAPGGHHSPGAQSKNALRVTVEEAAVLQSFPADYPWQGSKTAQYRQVGDAVPPLLAQAVLAPVLAADIARTTEWEIAS